MLITRPAGEGRALAEALRADGCDVHHAPCVQVVRADPAALAGAVRALPADGWLVVTSPAGARAVGEAGAGGRSAAPLAALGAATAEAARVAGLTVSFVPSEPTGRALGSELSLRDGPVLLARSDRSSRELPDLLRARGAAVREIATHTTVSAFSGDPVAVPAFDVAIFASPSAVEGFASALSLAGARAVAIGETTAAAVRSVLGVEPLVASGPDESAIADAVKRVTAVRVG